MSDFYNSLFEKIVHNRDRALAGKHNSIPFNLQRLNNFVPGVEQATYYLITGATKSGKTQLSDELFFYTPIEFVTSNETDIKIKGFYFSQEMSKEAKISKFITRELFRQYNLLIDSKILMSKKKNKILNEEYLGLIKKVMPYIEQSEDYFTIFQGAINPYGIYKVVKEYMLQNGKVHYKELQLNGDTIKVFDRYEPNNPNEYVIVIIDHLSLLTSEKNPQTGEKYYMQKDIIEKHSNNCVELRNNYGVTFVNIQQQSSAVEMLPYTNSGHLIVNKLKPSGAGLAETKLTQRDANVMIGTFGPFRYNIEEYMGFDINLFQDRFRTLEVLVDRDGSPALELPLLFIGECNYYKELQSNAQSLTAEQIMYIKNLNRL